MRPSLDRRAGAVPKLQVSRDEIRVKMREQDVANLQAVAVRFLEVHIDVPPRIDDGRRARLLVTDEIRRLREAAEIELFEDHG